MFWRQDAGEDVLLVSFFTSGSRVPESLFKWPVPLFFHGGTCITEIPGHLSEYKGPYEHLVTAPWL